jgi:hypothetical protein
MSAQILAGNFTNGTTVSVRGNFNGWGTTTLTNDPAASNTNIYSNVITITDGVGVSEYYKFYYYNGGDQWENGDNRIFVQPNTNASVLPVVLFSGVAVNDLIPADTMVTFSVDMNGAVGTDAHVFDPNSDTIWINGEFANWYPWWGGVNPVPGPAQYQMYSAGGGIYTNTVLVSRGKNVSFAYKYGIGNGANGDLGPKDIEAPSGQDHHRSVRSTATGFYTMPQDKFGNQYGEPFFKSSAKADGQLKVGAPSGGTIPVSWLGRPGAFLQSATSIAGPWSSHTNTDGAHWSSGTATTNGLMSVTNWPATGTTFFRLTKP